MNLQSNDFELFDLANQFAQDGNVLREKWKDLQRNAHPDKFAAQGDASQRLAMQWSVRINEAYQRLKDPLKRAAYLCEINGFPVNAENNTAMPTSFLMKQMEWREALDDADDASSLDSLQDEVMSTRKELLADIGTLIDAQRDFAAAVAQVRALMFIERFSQDVDSRIDAMTP